MVADALAGELFGKITIFHYKERIRLSFRLSDTYKSDFVLIRGLIEFRRTKDVHFAYDRGQRTLTTDITANQLHQLPSFFSGILDGIKSEKKFRHALKMALEFERRYKLERESLYEILRNSTMSTHASGIA